MPEEKLDLFKLASGIMAERIAPLAPMNPISRSRAMVN
jgi:hypothetical protein